ncbi:hypothetical protein VP06_33120 [Methylobacterium aquaticum]|uniref:Uncharacterized protein n=1 Tax=Methylobacterium aquaticum TaxID=270351 RepID=A0A0J6RUH2_9HYPH|nr:hypothetical protein VP06_33120 [Methylobacterium aquaticum]
MGAQGPAEPAPGEGIEFPWCLAGRLAWLLRSIWPFPGPAAGSRLRSCRSVDLGLVFAHRRPASRLPEPGGRARQDAGRSRGAPIESRLALRSAPQ